MWLWIVGGAAVLGGILYLRRAKAASAAQQAADAASTAQNPTDNAVPYSIVPLDQGLSDQQYKDLLDAITKLQGPPSTTTGGGTTTPTNPPATPSGLAVIPGSITAQSVGVKWSPVTGATGYRVGYRNNANSTNPWGFTEVIAPQSSVTVGGLKGKTNWEFTVQSENGAGRSGYPAAVFATTK